MKSDMIWTLVAFAFYLAGMLLIGAAYMKKTKSSEDFFLGGRGLNGWVAALSAQASDMSGCVLWSKARHSVQERLRQGRHACYYPDRYAFG